MATQNVIRIAPGMRCELRFEPDFVNDSIIVMLGKASQFLLRAPLRGFGR